MCEFSCEKVTEVREFIEEPLSRVLEYKYLSM